MKSPGCIEKSTKCHKSNKKQNIFVISVICQTHYNMYNMYLQLYYH